MSGSAPIQREITSPMTVELSTTMTCKGFRLVELGTCGPANTTVVLHRLSPRAPQKTPRAVQPTDRKQSDEPDFLELRRDNVLVGRLHDVFIGACVQGIAAGLAAQMAENS
jgi:hypothetical protein